MPYLSAGITVVFIAALATVVVPGLYLDLFLTAIAVKIFSAVALPGDWFFQEYHLVFIFTLNSGRLLKFLLRLNQLGLRFLQIHLRFNIHVSDLYLVIPI